MTELTYLCSEIKYLLKTSFIVLFFLLTLYRQALYMAVHGRIFLAWSLLHFPIFNLKTKASWQP